ncbi:MAG: type II secretion system GspH family protein [Hydrogenothermaceae bacterium]|nr:type II secretion system GspH family protein [Hydrogenothermaceae bacterium]
MQLNKKDGFTLIELLIASLIIIFISLGFLRGIIFFMQYNMQIKMKDKATEVNKAFTEYFYTLPYNQINPTTYANNWDYSTCTITSQNCSFENSDSDGDGIPDFYDPYNGDNNTFYSNPLSVAGYLSIQPQNNTSQTCSCTMFSSCPSGLPNLCIASIKSDISNSQMRIYTAITIAKIANTTLESGKAIGVTTWYFDPITKKYKSIRSVVFRENNQ